MLIDEVQPEGPFNRLPDFLLTAGNIIEAYDHAELLAALKEEFSGKPEA